MAIEGPAEVALLVSLLVIPGGMILTAVAVVRRRSAFQAWPTIQTIEPTPGEAEPIACGFSMRSPGSYRALYPLGVCRVSPTQITVAVNKRGWSFNSDQAEVAAQPGLFGPRLMLSSDGATLTVWPLGRRLRSALSSAGWVIQE
jgi:hypothetical protein